MSALAQYATAKSRSKHLQTMQKRLKKLKGKLQKMRGTGSKGLRDGALSEPVYRDPGYGTVRGERY